MTRRGRELKSMNNQMPIGIIGVGLMGSMFAERLIAAGFGVLGYDIVAEKNERLRALGGVAASSGADVARRCDVIIIMVFNTDQVEDVVENDILQAVGRNSGKIVLCSSTVDPDRIAALGESASQRGLRFLETPVSGTSQQCREGLGVGLIGGDPALMAEVKAVLDTLYPRMFHIGGFGDGGRAKLAINLILGINRTALAEGLVFAERLGLDPAKFLDVAKTSAAYSRVMDGKGPKMVRGDFSPEGHMVISLKDATLMREQGRTVGQELPLLETYRSLLQACIDQGQGELDNSSVIMEIRRRGTAKTDQQRRSKRA
ncbi:MAG TPA: NAD(P)-dependent oxidoreductase [Xanthobacteraceae bacterium]|nr:NAD(P)-dependent oxidoreductase [Xanthobacteraceae bacterium]